MSDLDPRDVTYHVDPADERQILKEGAVSGWLYLTTGKPGPARAVQVVAYTDPEGDGFVEMVGDWQDVTVVDDRA